MHSVGILESFIGTNFVIGSVIAGSHTHRQAASIANDFDNRTKKPACVLTPVLSVDVVQQFRIMRAGPERSLILSVMDSFFANRILN